MEELRGTQRTLCGMLLLLQATVRGQPLHFLVRAGDDVLLPSNHVDQDTCDRSTWLYSRTGPAVELVKLGKINNNAEQSNRLSLTANCSLVIRKVSGEDVGRYTNREFEGGEQQGQDGTSELLVITMEEEDYQGEVVLSCVVLRFSACTHAPEWIYGGDTKDVRSSHSACKATVTFKPPPQQKSKHYKSLKCEVRNSKSGDTLQLDACSQFSCEPTGGPSGEGNIAPPAQSNPATAWWTWLIIALVGLFVLFTTIVVFIRWRAEGERTRTDKSKGKSSQHPGMQPGPEARQDEADPEEGVAYASVSYTKTSGGGARPRVKDGDDVEEAVTYSSVKAAPPSVNQPKK
ncbi:uncharacterized protein AB9W97_003063 [Spinachia spinachia]